MSKAQRRKPLGRRPGPSLAFDDHRQQIIDIAAKLFARNGYAATGITAIAAACGLTGKGAIYHYIGSKQDLLIEIAFRVLNPLYDDALKISGLDHESPITRLRLISETFLHFIAMKPDHVWVYEHDYRFLQDKHRDKFNTIREKLESIVLEIIVLATDQGAFHAMDARLAMFAFFNLHNRTIQWYRQEGPWSASFLSKEYCRILFNGFRGPREYPIDVETEVATFRTRNPGWTLTAPAQ
jgi:AcrR family transcriptional regulator